ncbi:hypothetical protein ABT297_03100 [Dactylosporangium sp. NPDC000555]|uniref:hypothetical protein n=1 Tax=Dactylosporangium sp. NPDC000555 TaxID=3154260 RepID=UPI0033199139
MAFIYVSRIDFHLRPYPDQDRLTSLRAQRDEYWSRKRGLSRMNDTEVQQILEEYGPIARRLLGKQ